MATLAKGGGENWKTKLPFCVWSQVETTARALMATSSSSWQKSLRLSKANTLLLVAHLAINWIRDYDSHLHYPFLSPPNKHVLPRTTNPMTTRAAAGSPTPLSITCSSTNDLDEAASSQGEDGAHVCVGGDDTNDLLSTEEGKTSKPIYSENHFCTNKANQYRFSHRELFYTSLQT